MADARPSFPLYARDWYIGTRGLSPAARAAHIDLMTVAWIDGHIPAAPETLRLIVGMDRPEWRKVWAEIEDKWPVDADGRRRNGKLESVRAEVEAYAEQKRRAGKLGGRPPKAERKQDESTPKAEAKQNASTDEANQKPASASASALHTPNGVCAERPRAERAEYQHPVPRNAWLGLVEAWNVVARRTDGLTVIDTADVPVPDQSKALRALRYCDDMAKWDERFARVGRSSWLTGKRPGTDGVPFHADLWWVLEHIGALNAGRYDDREPLRPRVVAGLRGGGVAATATPAAVAVIDPDYNGAPYRFHCEHTPPCTTWPQHRDHGTDAMEVSA